MKHTYKLIGRTPVPCENLREWTEWLKMATKTGEMKVAELNYHNACVSTYFLAKDFNPLSEENPHLFETSIYWADENMEDGFRKEVFARYSTWDEAEEGHARADIMVTDRLIEILCEVGEIIYR